MRSTLNILLLFTLSIFAQFGVPGQKIRSDQIQWIYGPTSQRHTSPPVGFFYYNTDSSFYQYYNGSGWVDMADLNRFTTIVSDTAIVVRDEISDTVTIYLSRFATDSLTASNGIVYFGRNFSQKIVKDTTTLKSYLPDSLGVSVFLKQLSNSVVTGGGRFTILDSAVLNSIYGPTLFTTGKKGVIFKAANGKFWVRNSFLEGNYITPLDFGAVPNDSSNAIGEKNRDAFQNAINFCAFNSKSWLLVPGRRFWVNKVAASSPAYCLDLLPGARIVGSSTQASTYGARISMRNNQNATLFYTKTVETSNDWWHDGYLENITLELNGNNNSVANGIYIRRSGEPSAIKNVKIQGIKGFGIKEGTSSAHGFFENISFFPATGASKVLADRERIGIHLRGGGQRTLVNISGDNLSPLILASASPNFKVYGLKLEGAYSGFTNSTAIWADSCDGNLSLISIENVKLDVSSLRSVIRNTGISFNQASLHIGQGIYTGYDSLVTSNVGGRKVGNIGQMIQDVYVSGNIGSAIRFYTVPVFPGIGSASNYIGFEDASGNVDGHIRSLSNVLVLRSPGDDVLIEEDGGTDLANFNLNLNTHHIASLFRSGIRLASTTKIDTVKYKSSGDSLQIYINGTGWKAFKLNSSTGN